jgi:uncharacterized metal-binding protein
MLDMTVPQCVKCIDRKCSSKDWDIKQLPEFCPMKYKEDIIRSAMQNYEKPEEKRLLVNSTLTEQKAYQLIRGRVIAVRPRILELIKLTKMMNWGKMGVAFCTGLRNEASRIVEILEDADLTVYSVCCKCGGFDKTTWGIRGEDKIIALEGNPDAFEAGCNPIVQAEVFNSEKTDLNIIVGLCIGHDIQFANYSKAPVTTIIVKDRVTGHNPFASLYSRYHHPRMWKEE